LIDRDVEDRSPDGDDRRRRVDPIGVGLATQLLDLDPGLSLEELEEGAGSRVELLDPDGCLRRDDRLGTVREPEDEATIPTRRDHVSRREWLAGAKVDTGFDCRGGARTGAIDRPQDLHLSLKMQDERPEWLLRLGGQGQAKQHPKQHPKHPQDTHQPDLDSVHAPPPSIGSDDSFWPERVGLARRVIIENFSRQ